MSKTLSKISSLKSVFHACGGLYLATVLFPITVASGADDEPLPNVLLFDTGGVGAAKLGPRSGWKSVPEDNVTHAFTGDAVVANDRLTVAVRGRTGGAEVYTPTGHGLKLRATLSPLAGTGSASSVTRVQVLENSPAAVTLAVSCKTADGGSCALKYRLTAGQTLVEVRPGSGTERLFVADESRYAVVPDFFGDDMVFAAESLERPRLRLPTENFFLSFLDEGRAQLMCVWQSSRQGVVAIRAAQGPPAVIAGYEIQTAPDKPLWVAVLQGEALWHEQTAAAEAAKQGLTLAWKPPFPAKWRADLLGANGATRSWYFRAPTAGGEGAVASEEPAGPCCLEADRAIVHWPSAGGVSATTAEPGVWLTYAIDRSQTTPLNVFCPIDILRNTLGVGPCQYILQTEGLASESNPTPDNVMTYVEKQFQRKKEKKARDEIEDLLKQMVEHIGHAQARIDQYAGLARAVRKLCDDATASPAAAKALGRTADRLQQAAEAARGTPPAVQRTSQLAEQVTACIGTTNGLAECQRLGGELRAIGAVQDRAMSNCRMAVRWLKQSATMLAEDDPTAAEFAKAVLARAEQVLRIP